MKLDGGYDYGYLYSNPTNYEYYGDDYGEETEKQGEFGYFYLMGGCVYISWSSNASNACNFLNNSHILTPSTGEPSSKTGGGGGGGGDYGGETKTEKTVIAKKKLYVDPDF